MIDIKLLEQICLCNGISGDEGNVRNLIISEIKDYADDIKTDNLGNLKTMNYLQATRSK